MELKQGGAVSGRLSFGGGAADNTRGREFSPSVFHAAAGGRVFGVFHFTAGDDGVERVAEMLVGGGADGQPDDALRGGVRLEFREVAALIVFSRTAICGSSIR